MQETDSDLPKRKSIKPDSCQEPSSRYPEINEELRFHLWAATNDAMERGADRTSAEQEAAQRFSSLERTVEQLDALHRRKRQQKLREQRMNVWIDVPRSAYRTARRRPVLSLCVILLMGLGLGATAVTFGLLDRLLLQAPTGIEHPEQIRLVRIEREFIGRRITNTVFSFPDFRDFEGAETIVSGAAEAATQLTLGRAEEAERVRVVGTTGNYFQVLGSRPHRGRLLVPEDDTPASQPVAVIGYDLWKRRFNASQTVLGQTLDLKGGRFTVVGVMPRGYSGIGINRVDVWLPLHQMAPMIVPDEWREGRGIHFVGAMIRLAPTVSTASAAAELTTRHRVGRQGLRGYDPKATVKLVTLADAASPAAGKVTIAGLLVGVSLLLLLLVCTNVANLLLAQVFHQRRDCSVRLALGIDRRRLVAEQMAFGLLLTGAGGGLALAISFWGSRAVRSLLLPNIAWSNSGVDPRTLGIVLVAVLGSSLAATLLPALEARRTTFAAALGRGRDQIEGTRARRLLLTTQIALSVLMLVGASLFVRSFQQAASVDLGFDADGLVVVSIESEAKADPVQRQADLERALDWLQARPDFSSVSMAGVEPLRSSWSVRLRVPGIEELPRVEEGGPYIYPVSSGFFQTMGLEILRGRGFSPSDRKGSALVAVINQTMADLFWPDQVALGKCMIVNDEQGPCTEVIGIVEDAHRQAIVEGTQLLYYVPLEQEVLNTQGEGTFYARVNPAFETPGPKLSAGLLEELSTARHVRIKPFAELLAPQLETWRLGATLFGVFGALALVVATVGLHSTLAFEVARRQREIGVRTALGASSVAISRFVVARGLTPVVVGLVAGLVVARLAAPLASGYLFEVSANDTVTFTVVSITMLGGAALAVALPTLRAIRVNATDNLRAE